MVCAGDFGQQHFLGCSIRNFNLNIGWANDATTLTVGLVEDDALFERFDGFIGQLVRFQFVDWVFDGVLTNIREQKSQSGNRVWEVTISDPRDFMDGIQLIIGGYTGPTYNVPNLYNIYGYLESFGYGNSLINEAGIPWRLVRDAFIQLNQVTPAYLGGYPYFIDLSNLPDIPNDYRISSTNISLLDFIQEICELANHDFTVVMIGNFITVLTVSRNIQQLNGSITRLLQQLPQYINIDNGFELQYNTTNKFLVGAQVEQMYFQFNNVGANTSGTGTSVLNPTYDDTIARYWGKDLLGNLRIANRVPVNTAISGIQEANEEFYVDGKPISNPGMPWFDYPTDMDELRCVMESFESWVTFLAGFKRNPPPDVPHKSGSIHFGKYERLNLPGDTKIEKMANPTANLDTISPKDLMVLERRGLAKAGREQEVQKVYDYLNNFANEYMDKKFMVRIPFVLAKRNEDFTITTSLEPTSSAYIEESLIANAAAIGLLPNYPYFVLNEENKLNCYVRFGPFDAQDIDLSEIPDDDYYIDRKFVFVKAEVDPELVFLNKNTAFSPRAVITIPGRIKVMNPSGSLSMLSIEYQLQRSRVGGNIDAAHDAFQRFSKHVGADVLYINKEPPGLVPGMAAIPLRDNQTTYGPWYTQGMQGRVEFIQDTDLNPWNYGGFANMNLAGHAMVRDAYTNTMIGEAGSVEVPGSPLFSIAHQIFAGGPVITSINTSVGENGVTTTYRMEKWNQQYGKAIRHRLEQFKKQHALRRENQRKFAKIAQPNTIKTDAFRFGSIAAKLSTLRKPRHKSTRSTHTMLMASTYPKSSGIDSVQGINVGTVPMYQVPDILDTDDWESIGGVGMDALFIPYSTDSSLWTQAAPSGAPSGFSWIQMPTFEEPTVDGITINELNPFKDGHGISAAVSGPGTSGHKDMDLSNNSESIFRGIALRGPLVIASWGYDTNGNPVPGTSGEFSSGYLQDISQWKVGPLDIRWDDSRKVWDAGGSSLGQSRIVRTPPGGIPARSDATIQSRYCAEQSIVSGELTSTSTSLLTYNIWPINIPGDYYISVDKINESGYVASLPGVLNSRVNGITVQHTYDNVNYFTWHLGTNCSGDLLS